MPFQVPASPERRLEQLTDISALVEHPVYVATLPASAAPDGTRRVLASAFMGNAVIAIDYSHAWHRPEERSIGRVALFAAGVYCPGSVSDAAAVAVSTVLHLPRRPKQHDAAAHAATEGQSTLSHGERGCGVVDSPWGLLASAGRVFVSSFGSDQVLVFSEAGAYIGHMGSSAILDCPQGMALDEQRGILFVVSFIGNSIARFEASTGRFLGYLLQPGEDVLHAPEDCALQQLPGEASPRLLVTSHWDDSVHAFDTGTGAYLGRLVGGAPHETTTTPKQRDPAHEFWLQHRPAVRDVPRTAHATKLAARAVSATGGADQDLPPLSPVGIHVQTDGHFLVASFRRNAVMRYPPQGGEGHVYVRGGGVRGPSGLAAGDAGEVFVTSYDNHKVLLYNATSAAVGDGAHGDDLRRWVAYTLTLPSDRDGSAGGRKA